MCSNSAVNIYDYFHLIIRTSAKELDSIVHRSSIGMLLFLTVVGSGAYGSSIGIWRSALQACYAAVKFPFIIILAVLTTSILIGLIAQICGLRLSFLEGFRAILASFALTSIILGALSPVMHFLVYNAPHYLAVNYEFSYGVIRLSHVAAISLAGILGTSRLFAILRGVSPTPGVAARVLTFWLALNLFVGAQYSWVLRPFIGSPLKEVELLRNAPLKGNFYEEVWKSLIAIT